jgi:hypothetical protein
VAGTDSQHRADYDAGAVQRRSRWWIAALTFVVGIVVGVLAVGLLDIRRPDFSSRPGSAPSTTPSPAGGQSVPGAAGAEVNAACLRVINEAHDVSVILSEVGPAASAVDLQQLDDVVRQLQSIQPRLDRDLADCNVKADIAPPAAEPSASSTPSPAAEPSASSTPSPAATPTR